MDRPRPAGISEVSMVILETMVVLQLPEVASPHALNKVAKGGSSALLAVSSKVPSVVSAISSTRVVPPVERSPVILPRVRSITLRVLLPSPAYSQIPCAAVPSGPDLLVMHVLFVLLSAQPTKPPIV